MESESKKSPSNHYCDSEIRVRYAETDQMGVVYYANYLIWFEVGRSEYCRKQGFSYQEMERETESFLIVAEARCRYLRPLRYDDLFIVRTWVRELRRRSMTFAYRLLDLSGRTLYAEGETVHVVTDKRGRPKSFPDKYRDYLEPVGNEPRGS
jgi:acyl-CoA thioester hydrolase